MQHSDDFRHTLLNLSRLLNGPLGRLTPSSGLQSEQRLKLRLQEPLAMVGAATALSESSVDLNVTVPLSCIKNPLRDEEQHRTDDEISAGQR